MILIVSEITEGNDHALNFEYVKISCVKQEILRWVIRVLKLSYYQYY